MKRLLHWLVPFYSRSRAAALVQESANSTPEERTINSFLDQYIEGELDGYQYRYGIKVRTLAYRSQRARADFVISVKLKKRPSLPWYLIPNLGIYPKENITLEFDRLVKVQRDMEGVYGDTEKALTRIQKDYLPNAKSSVKHLIGIARRIESGEFDLTEAIATEKKSLKTQWLVIFGVVLLLAGFIAWAVYSERG